MSGYPKSFVAARLYKKTSAKGTTYFTGRLGGVKVALLSTGEITDSGEEIWNLLFQDGNSTAPSRQSHAEGRQP